MTRTASTASCLISMMTCGGSATPAPNAPTKNDNDDGDYRRHGAKVRVSGASLPPRIDPPVCPILRNPPLCQVWCSFYYF